MEPVGVGNKEEYLYDCYTLSHIERSFDGGHGSEIRRKTNWVPINPFGEAEKQITSYDGGSQSTSSGKGIADLPSYESFDLNRSAVLDEETFSMEPGIVFFEVILFCLRLHLVFLKCSDMVICRTVFIFIAN
jgi:ELMO domain-containing protein